MQHHILRYDYVILHSFLYLPLTAPDFSTEDNSCTYFIAIPFYQHYQFCLLNIIYQRLQCALINSFRQNPLLHAKQSLD